ncbi:MAG: PspC domain-containing protein [Bacteroidaceae bacterium]|nr:PspC domain-containing protein [Bacteroidaceae bacterium]
MKKTINIHLCNRIFTIDEDACQLLESYITNMRTYFSKREDGLEIADDIEQRVAELLAEFTATGTTCITLPQVQEVIARIGNPEEIEGDEAPEQPEEVATAPEAPHAETDERTLRRNLSNKMLAGVISGLARYFGFSDATPWRILFIILFVFTIPITTVCYLVGWLIIPADGDAVPVGQGSDTAPRQLFRDGRNKMLGGVISGLCAYFGGKDVTPWRLLFVVLCFMSASLLLILYIAMWLIVPEAVTAEDRLRMKGEKVNFENVNREVMSEMRTSEGHSSVQKPAAFRWGRVLLHIALLIIVLPIIFTLLMGVIAAISFLLILTASVTNVCSWATMPHLPELTAWITVQPTGLSWLLYTSTICGFLIVAIPLYALIRSVFASDSPLSKGVKITLITLWVLALSIGIATVITTCYFCVPM